MGGQRIYAWLDEVAQLEEENERLRELLHEMFVCKKCYHGTEQGGICEEHDAKIMGILAADDYCDCDSDVHWIKPSGYWVCDKCGRRMA